MHRRSEKLSLVADSKPVTGYDFLNVFRSIAYNQARIEHVQKERTQAYMGVVAVFGEDTASWPDFTSLDKRTLEASGPTCIRYVLAQAAVSQVIQRARYGYPPHLPNEYIGVPVILSKKIGNDSAILVHDTRDTATLQHLPMDELDRSYMLNEVSGHTVRAPGIPEGLLAIQLYDQQAVAWVSLLAADGRTPQVNLTVPRAS